MASQDPGHRVARSLGVRLAFWYGAIFIASALLIAVLAYRLLERSLIERDHEIVRVKLADYAARFDSTGVDGVSQAVAAEQASGSDEHVFVRLVSSNAEVVLASMPSAWGSYDLGQLGDGQTGVEGWQIGAGPRRAGAARSGDAPAARRRLPSSRPDHARARSHAAPGSRSARRPARCPSSCSG